MTAIPLLGRFKDGNPTIVGRRNNDQLVEKQLPTDLQEASRLIQGMAAEEYDVVELHLPSSRLRDSNLVLIDVRSLNILRRRERHVLTRLPYVCVCSFLDILIRKSFKRPLYRSI